MPNKPLISVNLNKWLPAAKSNHGGLNLDFSPTYLMGVARAQKRLLWYFLMGIPLIFSLIMFVIFASKDVIDPLLSVVVVGLVVVLYQTGAVLLEIHLAKKMLPIWAVAVLAVASLIFSPLIVVLLLNWLASAMLRTNGVKVGLLGANRADLQRLQATRGTVIVKQSDE